MLICRGSNIAELYKEALITTMVKGYKTKPRGFDCHEISPCTLILTDPTKNILNDKVRKINKAFAAAEFMHIWTGRSDVEFIAQFNSQIRKFSDDGLNFFGAYGPKWVNQSLYIFKILKEDPWTRQAVMTIWRENPPQTKDVPCTIALHFIRRPIDTLNLIVYMRSNDIWLGLPYDIHNFTCLQIAVTDKLGLKLGTYTQVDGSLHAYAQDSIKIRDCIMELKNTDYEKTNTKTMFEDKKNIMQKYLKKKNENNNRKNT